MFPWNSPWLPLAWLAPPVIHRPVAISDTTRAEQPGSGRGLSLNRVQKNIREAGTTHGARASFWQPVIPPAPLTGDVGRGCGDASRALLFFKNTNTEVVAVFHGAPMQIRRAIKHAGLFPVTAIASRLRHPLRDSCFKRLLFEATLGARLRELRWKNSAWLATADTIAGWNGFEIRNAGSGRSPVRKRSG